MNDVGHERPPRLFFVQDAHTRDAETCLRLLSARRTGLTEPEVAERALRAGPNRLPPPRTTSLLTIVVRQFRSPIVYTLLAAAIVALATGERGDAAIIALVLLVDAAIGTVQEAGAERSARSLEVIQTSEAVVIRSGIERTVAAESLVPGDIVVVDAGMKVPADVRLLSRTLVEVDESLLTGESLAVVKDASVRLPLLTGLADRQNQLFAGTMLTRGRAVGLVVETGLRTQLGRIAGSLQRTPEVRPPLLQRMDAFTRRVGLAVGVAVLVLGAMTLARGASFLDALLLAIALAVAAIPEGLPVSITVALAVGSRAMARRHVIARRLVAVESLGSCTFIATDKTGTLTMNELTVGQVALADSPLVHVEGEGIAPIGQIDCTDQDRPRILRLAAACALCNDASLRLEDDRWVAHGDAVDVALLVFSRKAALDPHELTVRAPRAAELHFDPTTRFAATLHRHGEGHRIVVKGAPETVLGMCTHEATSSGDRRLRAADAFTQVRTLAAEGYRVIAVAAGAHAQTSRLDPNICNAPVEGLTLLGLLALRDPLRPESAEAVQACQRAGIAVAMLTGDHPVTALAIARDLGLAHHLDEVVTGEQIAAALRESPSAVEHVVSRGRVFARVEPVQKLEVVEALVRMGHFVAVTGDGANDAPALRAAHIGVAMGKKGTDLARSSADLIITNDDFASLLAGVEEGRVAYANVRKVIYLLISCGLAEVILFTLTTLAAMPTPLLPVHLLWLNLVTNGIQDVALAFEPAEGGELSRPPRAPREPIFDASMRQRTLLTAGYMALAALYVFREALVHGASLASARNDVLLLLVLCENVQAGNSRSETGSALGLSPLRNPPLLVGTLTALGSHVAAMHVPVIQEALRLEAISLARWASSFTLALGLLVVAELQKGWLRSRLRAGSARR